MKIVNKNIQSKPRRNSPAQKQIRVLLDLSSPASSESVMFLSRTGFGGQEKRLTKAMMVGNGAALLRNNTERHSVTHGGAGWL